MNDLLGTLRTAPEGATATFERTYPTTPTDLWDALTDPDRLARWFAPVEGDLRPGGSFVIHFDDADTPECRLVACQPERQLEFEWPTSSRLTVVRLRLEAAADATTLHLTHELLTEPSAPGYAAGWEAYLRELEDHLGGEAGGRWWEQWATLRDRYAELLPGG
ncbi:SRPBCC family protein [Kytococcus sedentarius]|uniref:Uncharacterized conserved protein n=1 Tax=Kytococcus sedentarius (strain ATCC 14392 / DSM 20547 / JCM 11482 / CCUG 33030 / NBRC 15357 / NCTC 11040 / CCM 314 / 541) TaxID=478801 RepID=C7NLX1_KYTSD|nr:SRPBCC family protein [Kytococcus sedentarius]ACV07220.1 uncharacterized conserved protein [Kytococcus sedentarius DSM 20547]QQB63188.1 SRPBCC family protein [Kytococcus sedentarius]STX13947.1 Activator of Hsp90 ATPase homolog 1-like protein [Kytococcus sedentarius]